MRGLKKIYGRAAISAVIIVLLSSCSRLLENEYRSVTPLEEPAYEPFGDNTASLRVSNYSELKIAVLRFVRNGNAEGRVRLRSYSGNARSDVDKVCLEVMRNEPIGAYALEYLTSGMTQVITDY
ncbi:MAG: hypothetical protein FWH16_05180, partial [Oscillospiraceae bacterium]|nr:hypothetical protein [Oscillospiraceae bacterium]